MSGRRFLRKNGVFSMGKLKKLGILAILLISGSLCFANQISFQIVQHDESLDSVSEDSMVIEDSVLNNFFEFGYIVTNSDAAISSSAEYVSNILFI